nr:hypothetical protein [uncultured Sphingomonas sp.]
MVDREQQPGKRNAADRAEQPLDRLYRQMRNGVLGQQRDGQHDPGKMMRREGVAQQAGDAQADRQPQRELPAGKAAQLLPQIRASLGRARLAAGVRGCRFCRASPIEQQAQQDVPHGAQSEDQRAACAVPRTAFDQRHPQYAVDVEADGSPCKRPAIVHRQRRDGDGQDHRRVGRG